MKLKIAQVKTALDCYLQLDGYDEIARVAGPDDDLIDKVVKKPYKLSGKTRWNISKNIDILSSKMNGFEKVKNDLITEISEGRNVIEKDEVDKMTRFNQEILSILDDESDIQGLLKLTAKELKLDLDEDVNQFPSSVIHPLMALELII